MVKNLTLILFLSLISLLLSAQGKTQAYYNRHEKEIIPDATNEFKKGNYERTIELCKWHYIIVGDNSADSLREMAERCVQLTSDIKSIKSEAEDKIKDARLMAVSLLSVNANDPFARDYLQWSERTLSDTLSTPLVSYFQSQETEPLLEMVDLGLSVMWATCNLGASRPEEIGDSYAWGETDPIAKVTDLNTVWDHYKWSQDNHNHTELSRYCTDSDFGANGFVDHKVVLLLEDDAANVNLGGKWRVPTEKETMELLKKCVWQWAQVSGIDGFRVISKINGNSIFLPMTGLQSVYWTSSLKKDQPYFAAALALRSASYRTTYYARYNGLVIRPVFGK